MTRLLCLEAVEAAGLDDGLDALERRVRNLGWEAASVAPAAETEPGTISGKRPCRVLDDRSGSDRRVTPPTPTRPVRPAAQVPRLIAQDWREIAAGAWALTASAIAFIGTLTLMESLGR